MDESQDLKQLILQSVMEKDGVDPVVVKFLLQLEKLVCKVQDDIDEVKKRLNAEAMLRVDYMLTIKEAKGR